MSTSTPHTVVGRTTVAVRGMTCGHCERAITSEVSRVEGVRYVLAP